jgi:hypothetical protein
VLAWLVNFRTRRRTLLRSRGIFLGNTLHLRHGISDLVHTARLLLAALVDFIHQGADLAGAFGHGPNRARHLIQTRVAVVCGGDRFLDQSSGVPGRLRAALRQVAHFVGDYREAEARLAGAGRLNRGVQRQNVGLESDLVNRL